MAAIKTDQIGVNNPNWKGGTLKRCGFCGKEFSDTRYKTGVVCCSYTCANNLRWKDKKNKTTCLVCGKEFYSQPFFRRKFCSHKCFGASQRGIPKPQTAGSKNGNWKGGITQVNLKDRYTIEYRAWRQAVLERDSYKCLLCGSSDHLEVDHIKPFSQYPNLRFSLENGQTLCKYCHVSTHRLGRYRFISTYERKKDSTNCQ